MKVNQTDLGMKIYQQWGDLWIEEEGHVMDL